MGLFSFFKRKTPEKLIEELIQRFSGLNTKPASLVFREIEEEIFAGQHGELGMSQNDAIYLYIAWQRKDVRTKLEADGFDETSYQQLLRFLTTESMQLAEFIKEEVA